MRSSLQKDNELTFGHLQKLFSLLKELINDLSPLVCNGQEIRADKFNNLKNFLFGKKPYNKFRTNITANEVEELNLAKETGIVLFIIIQK